MKKDKLFANSQMVVGKNIEYLRKLKDRTVKEISSSLEISKVAYRNYERGISDIPLTKFLHIVSLLQVNYGDVLDESMTR